MPLKSVTSCNDFWLYLIVTLLVSGGQSCQMRAASARNWFPVNLIRCRSELGQKNPSPGNQSRTDVFDPSRKKDSTMIIIIIIIIITILSLSLSLFVSGNKKKEKNILTHRDCSSDGSFIFYSYISPDDS